MKTRRDIVLELHDIHRTEHREESDADCPMCEARHNHQQYMLSFVHEENLMKIIQSHQELWKTLGARIANGMGSHRLPGELVSLILNYWIEPPPMEPDDVPEDYLRHPTVTYIFQNQKK